MKRMLGLAFLFNSPCLFGQGKFITAVYQLHSEVCYVTDSEVFDYILEIFNDDTIRIDMYKRHCNATQGQLYKVSFTGKGNIIKDTLKITWLLYGYQDRKSKQPLTRDLALNKNDSFVKYPSTVFALKDDKAVAVDGLFPALNTISVDDYFLLESEFDGLMKNKNRVVY